MNIPEYAPQIPGINVGPQARADERPQIERVTSLTSGLHAIARGEESVASGQAVQADALQRSQIQADKTRTGAAVMGGMAELTQGIDAISKDIFNDPEGINPAKYDGLVPRLQKMVSTVSERVVGEATTPEGRDMARAHFNELWTRHVLPHAILTEAHAATAYAHNNIQNSITNGEATVSAHPEMFDTVLALTNDSIHSAANLAFADRLKFRNTAQTRFAWAAVNTSIRLDPSAVAVATKGPLAQRFPAIIGSMNGAAPYVAEPPIVGTPLGVDNARADIAAEAARQPVLVKGVLVNPPPAAAPATPEPPPTPPTDAEITAKIPAWRYLTPEHQQQFRNTAATLLNQQGAYAAKALEATVASHNAAAEQGIPAQNPIPPAAWMAAGLGGSTQAIAYAYNQARAHAFQQLAPDATSDQLRAYASAGRPWEGAPAQVWAAFKRDQSEAFRRIAQTDKAALDLLEATQAGQFTLAALGQKVTRLTPADYAKVPGMPEGAFAAYTKGMDAAETVASGNASIPDIQRAVKSLTPSGNPLTAIAELKAQNFVASGADRLLKSWEADPAQGMLDAHPELATERAAAFGDKGTPQMVETYLQHQEAAQQQQMPNWRPVLVTKADIAQLSAIFNTNTAGYGSPDKQLQNWRKTVAQYGSRFGDVMAAYKGGGGKLPPELEYVNWMEDGKGTFALDQSHAVQLATIKEPDLEKSLGHSGVTGKQIAAASSMALHDIKVGLVDNPENEALFNALNSVVTKKTASLVSHGDDVATAVARAAAPVLGRVKVYPNGSGLPGMMIPTDANPDLVRDGARLALGQLKASDLQVPPSGITEKGEAAAQYLGRVTQRPVWISDGNSLGLYTADQFGGLIRVRRADGKPLAYTFNNLRFMAGEFTGVPTVTEPTALEAMRNRQR